MYWFKTMPNGLNNTLIFLIAILALGTLVSKKASASAMLLFGQSIMINILIAKATNTNYGAFTASLLLTFFTMVMLGSNYYVEASFNQMTNKASKVSLIIGSFMVLIFLKYIDHYLPALDIEISSTRAAALFPETKSLLLAGFSLFAILISALLIFDLRSNGNGV